MGADKKQEIKFAWPKHTLHILYRPTCSVNLPTCSSQLCWHRRNVH